jgi:hypothetical protein
MREKIVITKDNISHDGQIVWPFPVHSNRVISKGDMDLHIDPDLGDIYHDGSLVIGTAIVGDGTNLTMQDGITFCYRDSVFGGDLTVLKGDLGFYETCHVKGDLIVKSSYGVRIIVKDVVTVDGNCETTSIRMDGQQTQLIVKGDLTCTGKYTDGSAGSSEVTVSGTFSLADWVQHYDFPVGNTPPYIDAGTFEAGWSSDRAGGPLPTHVICDRLGDGTTKEHFKSVHVREKPMHVPKQGYAPVTSPIEEEYVFV